MCRLFGAISTKALKVQKYLLDDPCSIFIQSKADPNRLQSDGWGIGFYVNDASKLIKSEKPIFMERNKFAEAIQNTNSRIVLAHVRRASNPRNLPKERLISIENSQPFNYERYIFAHNGVINIPNEIAEHIGEWKNRLRGFNDSEVYFWYIIKEMINGSVFSEAIKRFKETLSALWKKSEKKHNHDRPYIGLNALLSDGRRLYAYCKYDIKDETKTSLCLKDQPVFQMSYIADSEGLIVTSERTNRENKWKVLKSGELLTGEIDENKIKIHLQRV